MNGQRAQLGDIMMPITRVDPARLSVDAFQYIDITSVDRQTKSVVRPLKLLVSDAPSRARQLLQADDLLVSTVRPNLNGVGIVPPHFDGAVGSTGFCVLRADRSRAQPRYLYYYIQSQPFIARLTRIAAGASYPAVSDHDVRETPLFLPSIDRQEQIIAGLDAASALRRTRRYALELCDELLPAVFLEMFGDFRSSTPDLEIVELKTIADIVSGVTKGQRHNGRETVTVPYLRVANVQDGYLDLSEMKTITASTADARDLALKAGDVVMTEGGDFDKLGRGAIWQGGIEGCIHQNHIFRVRLDHKKALPIYFASFLRSAYAKEYFLSCAKQTTNLASINMTQLKATPVPLPSLRDQAHFGSAAAEHATLRATHVEALRQADHLFQTLLHQAFAPTI